MSMSNEHLEQINKRIWDALWGLEVRGDTGWAEVVVRADAPELLTEVKRLKEALTITDEMVEHAAEAMYLQEYDSGWDEYPMEDEKEEFRELAREVLEATLGGGES